MKSKLIVIILFTILIQGCAKDDEGGSDTTKENCVEIDKPKWLVQLYGSANALFFETTKCGECEYASYDGTTLENCGDGPVSSP